MPDARDFADADLIEAICDECEQQLGSEGRVDLLPLAQRCETRLWGRLIPELLLLDIGYARKAGRRPTREEYRERYPDFRHHLEVVAAALELENDRGERLSVSSSPNLRATAIFAHFELVRELGCGASGVVWEAIDLGTTRSVAIKIPRWHELSIDERLRFFREARALSRLSHKGIAKLFEVSTFEGCPYLASELVPGETLRDTLKRGPLAPDAAAKLCLEVAESLQHAHERGVIHRDVKPANILIHPDGRPCLTDFGLATCHGDGSALTEHGDILGSPAYMSPEQARGRTVEAGPQTDLYALGAVLFEALTGRTPFTGGRVSILRDVIDEEVEAPSPKRFRKELPADLVAICRMALQKRPPDRYSSAEAMAADLRRYLRGETIQAHRPSVVVRSFRWSKRNKRLIVSMLTVAAITLLASALISKALVPDDHRLVEIETIPAGARVAFVPLSDRDEQPVVNDAVFGKGTGPVRAKLYPGDYFVVAVTRDGRFHEVFRRVPATGEEQDVAGFYQRVQINSDGVAMLNPIRIPSKEVIATMARVAGAEGFPLGEHPSSGFEHQTIDLPTFYMDPVEFRLVDYKKHYPKRRTGRTRFGGAEAPPEIGWACSYFEAVDAAEAAGKRLLTEAEYEYVATACGTARYPWGDGFPDMVEAESFGPVGSVPFDCYEGSSRPIYGLCSNLAEWVAPSGLRDPARPDGYGIVRGGNSETIRGNPAVSAISRDPKDRQYAVKQMRYPGLGFRGARSAAPLIHYDAIK